MSVIEFNKEDYEFLMEISKELITQDKDFQASPRFWSPRSTKKGIGTHDDELIVVDDGIHTPEEYFECTVDSLAEEFIKENEIEFKNYEESIDEYEWIQFLKFHKECDISYYFAYQKDIEECENNFSIFKSDVKNFIEGNRHHLGKNPHTYANTFFRMSKMERLVKILCGINGNYKDYI